MLTNFILDSIISIKYTNVSSDGKTSGWEGHVRPVDQNQGFYKKFVKEERRNKDGDHLCKDTKHPGTNSRHVFNLNLWLIFSPLLNDKTSGGETSSCVVHLKLVDQPLEGFQEKALKKEELNEDDYLCKTTGPGA